MSTTSAFALGTLLTAAVLLALAAAHDETRVSPAIAAYLCVLVGAATAFFARRLERALKEY